MRQRVRVREGSGKEKFRKTVNSSRACGMQIDTTNFCPFESGYTSGGFSRIRTHTRCLRWTEPSHLRIRTRHVVVGFGLLLGRKRVFCNLNASVDGCCRAFESSKLSQVTHCCRLYRVGPGESSVVVERKQVEHWKDSLISVTSNDPSQRYRLNSFNKPTI